MPEDAQKFPLETPEAGLSARLELAARRFPYPPTPTWPDANGRASENQVRGHPGHLPAG